MKPVKKFLSVTFLTALALLCCFPFTSKTAAEGKSFIQMANYHYDSDYAFALTGTEGKNKKDLAALKKILEKVYWHDADDLDYNLNNKKNYKWDKNGRLTKLNLGYNNYEGDTLSLSAFSELTVFKCPAWIKSLDVSKNKKLKKLNCYNNRLEALDVSNNKELTELHCYENNLKKLNVSNNINLTKLDCLENNLTKLNISKNKKLKELHCDLKESDIIR